MTTTATILALDASSTAIGWAVLDGAVVRDHDTCQLRHADINERCRLAHAYVAALLRAQPDIDCVAVESPVARFPSAVIPQCLVSGAVRAAVRAAGLHVVDVSPAAAKAALCGSGVATKAQMQARAKSYGVTGEHAADAVGVALAAVGMVEVTR